MKKFIALLSLTLVTTLSFGAETEKVCIDKMTKDGKPVLDKAGKPQQECKTIKVHKKLEGTKVPEKK
jgi:hypothetical protein